MPKGLAGDHHPEEGLHATGGCGVGERSSAAGRVSVFDVHVDIHGTGDHQGIYTDLWKGKNMEPLQI